VRRVAEVLETSRSQSHELLRKGTTSRRRHLQAEDAKLLGTVRQLVDERLM
jgi:hypothetical protein